MGRGREPHKPTSLSVLLEYLGAVTLIALATWTRMLLDESLGDRLLFLVYLPLLVAMAWFYRQGPVALATLLSLLASQRFLIPPRRGGLVVVDPIELVQIGLYLFVVLATLMVARALKGAKAAAEESAKEARLAAEALGVSEEQFRASFELAAVGNTQTDPATGRFQRVNAKMCDITGYSRQELLDRTFYDLTHPADREVTRREMARLASGAAPAYVLENRYVRKDGAVVWVRVSATMVRDAQGRPDRCLAVIEDITERKQAQEAIAQYRDHLEDIVRKRTLELEASHERLRRADRLASLGTLSAGLGHDLGNLLMPLGMRLDVLRSMPLPPAARAEVEAIETCVEYLAALARGLRLCTLDPEEAGGGAEDDEPDARTNLATWVRDTEPLLRMILGKSVTLEVDVPPGVPEVALAPHRLTQCAVNLTHNARDAIEGRPEPGTGVVRVSAARDEAGETVRLSIRDNGRGMTDDVKARCLEPFYTTRVRGLSTGLGLPLVNGTVRACGGRLQIESSPDNGTTVTMHLSAAESPPRTAGPASPSERPGAVVSISDPRIATLVGTVLSSSGYAVRHGEPNDADGAGVWVTDGVPGGVRAPLDVARDYLRQGPAPRRVVILGSAPPEWREIGAVSVSNGITPNAIREAVQV